VPQEFFKLGAGPGIAYTHAEREDMGFDLVAHFCGNLGLRDYAKTVRHTVGGPQHLGDVVCDFREGQVLAIDTLDADRFVVLTDAPDVTPEVASGLAVPFQRTPAASSPVIGKHKALEVGAVKIVEMNRVHGNCEFRHSLPRQ
jgi:hypothetical protein